MSTILRLFEFRTFMCYLVVSFGLSATTFGLPCWPNNRMQVFGLPTKKKKTKPGSSVDLFLTVRSRGVQTTGNGSYLTWKLIMGKKKSSVTFSRNNNSTDETFYCETYVLTALTQDCRDTGGVMLNVSNTCHCVCSTFSYH